MSTIKNFVCVDGYEMKERGRGHIFVARSDRFDEREIDSGVYRKFLQMDTSDNDAMYAFVNEHGLLGFSLVEVYEFACAEGERLLDWMEAVEEMWAIDRLVSLYYGITMGGDDRVEMEKELRSYYTNKAELCVTDGGINEYIVGLPRIMPEGLDIFEEGILEGTGRLLEYLIRNLRNQIFDASTGVVGGFILTEHCVSFLGKMWRALFDYYSNTYGVDVLDYEYNNEDTSLVARLDEHA